MMIYHRHSLVGYMLWARYALLAGKPWRGLNQIYAEHLESPGTKAYTVDEARSLFRMFEHVHIHTVLTHGDLLSSGAGQRHPSRLLSVGKRLWPRKVLRAALPSAGLFMLIEAKK